MQKLIIFLLFIIIFLSSYFSSSSSLVSAQQQELPGAQTSTTTSSPLNQSLAVYFTLNLGTFQGANNFSIGLAALLSIDTQDMAVSYNAGGGQDSLTMFFTNVSNQNSALASALNLNSTQLESIGAIGVAFGTTTTTTTVQPVPQPTDKPFPQRDVGVVIGSLFGWCCVIAGVVYLWKRTSDRRALAQQRAKEKGGAEEEEEEISKLAMEQSMLGRDGGTLSSSASGNYDRSIRLEHPELNYAPTTNASAAMMNSQLSISINDNGHGSKNTDIFNSNSNSNTPSRSKRVVGFKQEEDDGSDVL